MPNSNDKSEQTFKVYYLYYLVAFGVYLTLRVVAWGNPPLLESADSTGYLDAIKVFLTFDLEGILGLEVDSTPFYPFFGALLSLPAGSTETGARLCSLLFSCLLFVTIIGIGRRFARPFEIAIGLLILATSPFFIRHSYSVLTEPSYVATIYLGFWLFLSQFRQPTLFSAVLLGGIFGLSFLNRIEGILYLAAIPLLQIIHFLSAGKKDYNRKRLIAWTTLFILVFSLLAAPQIWRVSNKMDGTWINGRQVWSLILNNPDEKSYWQKLYGLDYSPSRVNLDYLQEHPHDLRQPSVPTESSPVGKYMELAVEYAKLTAKNLDLLYREKLGILIGPLGAIFFAFGILALYRYGYRYELFFGVAFLLIGLIAPLVHSVVVRHIAIIAPLMMLLEGVGIVYLSKLIMESEERRSFNQRGLSMLLLTVMIGASMPSVLSLYLRPDSVSDEYRPGDLEEPVRIVKEVADKELRRPVTIVSAQGFIGHFTDSKRIAIPYTDYRGLVTYCTLNKVDLLFLRYRRIGEFPYLDDLTTEKGSQSFSLLYSGTDFGGEKIELYRFVSKV